MGASDTYLSTLARLSEAKASGQAEAIRAAAQAHAEAQRANAGLYGQSIATIGQMVSQYPEQQAKLKEIANRAALTQLETAREQRASATEQRNLQSQQQAQQIIANAPRNPDGTYDTASLLQKITANGGDPKTAEQIATSLDNINQFTLKYNQHQLDQGAEWADTAIKDIHPDDPNPWDAVHFHVAAAPDGFVSEADKKRLADLEQQGGDPRKLLNQMRAQGSQFKKESEIQKVGKGDVLGRVVGDKFQTVFSNTQPELPKTPEEVLFDSLNPKSPTQAISQAAVDKKAQEAKDAIANKPLTPYEREQLTRRDKEFVLEQQRLAEAIRNHNKVAATQSASNLADTVIAHPELWNQITPSGKEKLAGALAEKGFTNFAPKESATMENRLASAKAVVQTGNDITSQLKNPKIAAMLGPAMGRYNNLREFIGDPPPELSELAGNIGSFALAQMGVHGMRNAEMAKQIESMLDAKHTPESLAARIDGINKFANHLLENEHRTVDTPNAGGTGLPAVGGTFQGGKVLKVTPVP